VAPVPVAGGATPVPREPGLGLQIDWEAVAAHAVRHTATGAPA
jgi:L-alanine-DL-glutamate epimerase-like enolase superfamily enzyme